MNNVAWLAFLDTLPPDHKALALAIMERVQTVMNSDRQKVFDELQAGARRSDGNAARINDLDLRLDHYEAQRAKDVQSELERFANEQLPVEERDRLIGVLYNVVARLDALEARQVGGDDAGD